VAVMYAGKIVETGLAADLLVAPSHPYTRALILSVPAISGRADRLPSIEGQPPSILSPPSGCRFHPRCPLRERLGRPKRCQEEVPQLREIRPTHSVACHFAEYVNGGPAHDSGSRSLPSSPIHA
jgi:oligopeptide/dipeptide ABC transporter ATP-binding protein